MESIKKYKLFPMFLKILIVHAIVLVVNCLLNYASFEESRAYCFAHFCITVFQSNQLVF